ncbi:MAG TPA: enolase C-terminal domain-like protein [Thermoplasmata archaeon]|nr:enolase C-terminal domain-like protein [Thermoplasmata archaeon]
MSRVTDVRLRRIYDSRGKETVEATVVSDGGATGVAGAPSGASTGTHEVQAFPNGGVATALELGTSAIRPAVRGLALDDQAGFDAKLHEVDGTPNFARIGGNTATALSVAFALARAKEQEVDLARSLGAPARPTTWPAVVGNCLNGGRHAIGGPDIQEFIAFAANASPNDEVRAALAVHRAVGEELHRRLPTHALGRGDEGGWVAPVGNVEALDILAGACAKVRDELHLSVHPGVDLAASEFFRGNEYHYRDRTLDLDGQVAFLGEIVDRYGIRYLEDPLDQEEFDGFARVTAAVGSKCLVVGDDIYTTRRERLRTGLDRKSSNAILIKVNQVGTLTDTLATVALAKASGVATVTSHRSGDLPEGWLADLAVAFGSAGLKCGLLGGERVAKLNELLRLGAATEAPH